MSDSVRLDKFLWSIRVFKTRSEAADACNGNKIRVNGTVAKASKAIKPADRLEVHKGPVTFTYEVNEVLDHRIGAALVPDYVRDLTPDSERRKLHAPQESIFITRDKGSGRPTKKDRRILDALQIWDSDNTPGDYDDDTEGIS